eukprot:TRINITY_DN4140_c0_g1_i1.p2 TRINITY_DN4140_c0_g1~~TRINITY_DN4140_c0_g1_i1.p2  ORF type:complete len:58 (+),score=12.10 TRINITY_DN4140_c0_g1_i1:335-508(+)
MFLKFQGKRADKFFVNLVNHNVKMQKFAAIFEFSQGNAMAYYRHAESNTSMSIQNQT